MRLFAATLATETNTFSPLPTSLAPTRSCVFFGPASIQTMPRACARRRCSWPAGARRRMASR